MVGAKHEFQRNQHRQMSHSAETDFDGEEVLEQT